MAAIDNRVVQMTFDNAKFEQNAKTTQETLRKLDDSLAFKNGAKGLQDIQAAGNNFNMGGMAGVLDGITNKFDAWAVVGITALAKITSAAIDTGAQMIASLTIEPIAAGLNEYETKLNSIRTILTNTKSKGTTLDDVNTALADLNNYADLTIYNFGQMVNAIGKFTSAGVGLDMSVDAIKGFLNLGAGSGSSPEELARGMQQLAQALAEGRMSATSWNSMTSANVGGELFQRQLAEEAFALNQISEVDYNAIMDGTLNFRKALLSVGGAAPMIELTTETMINALRKFAEDPALIAAATEINTFPKLIGALRESVGSGWAQSWEIIIGDLQEATELFGEAYGFFNGIIGAQADVRNELLKSWKALGGREDLIQAFRNIGEAIMSIVTPISEAFSSVFAPLTAFDLANITDQFKRFTEGLILSEETMANLKTTFQGVFSIFDIIGKAIGFVIDVLGTLVGAVLPGAGDGFLGLTASVGEFFIGLNEAIESSEIFSKGLEKIQEFVSEASVKIPEYFNSAVSAIEEFTGISFQEINDKLYAMRMEIQNGITSGELLSSGWEKVKETLSSVAEGIQKTWDVMKNIFNQVKEFLKPFVDPMVDFIKKSANTIKESFQTMVDTGNWEPFFKAIETGFFGALVLGIRGFLKSLTGITDEASGFAEGLGNVLKGVTGVLNNFSASVQADALKKVAVAIAILTGALLVLSLIEADKLTNSLTAITALFIELVASFSTLQKTGILASAGGMSLAGSMIGFSIALAILAGALAKISSSDPERMLSSVAVIGLLMAELSAVSKSLTKVSGMFGMEQLLLISGAVYILADVVEKLGALPIEQALQGVIGVGLLLTELMLFTRFSKQMKPGEAFGFIGLSLGIMLLVSSVSKLGEIDLIALATGVGAVTILLAALGGFTRLASSKTDMIEVGVGIGLIAISMNILTKAIRDIGEIPLENVAIGLGSIVVSLAAFVGAMKLMPKRGFGVMENAGAIALMATAMVPLGLALKLLSTIPLAGMGVALGGVAVALGIFVGAARLLGPAAPALMTMAGAVTLLGAGLGLAGVGMLAFATGVGALAVVGTAGIAGFSLAIKAFLDTIPYAIQKVGEGLALLAQSVKENAPTYGEAYRALMLEGFKNIQVVVPELVDTIFIVLIEVMDSLQTKGLPLAEKLFDFIISVFGLLEEKVPEIVASVLSLLTTIFGEVTSQIGSFGVETTDMLLNAVESLAPIFLAFVAAGLLAKKAMAGAGAIAVVLGSIVGALFLLNMLDVQNTLNLINGLSEIILVLSAACLALSFIPVSGAINAIVALDVFVANLVVLLAAMGGLRQIPGLEWLIEEGAIFMEKLGAALGRFVGAIVGGVAVGFTAQLPQVATNMSEFAKNLEPFLESISKVKQSHIDAALGIVGLMLAFTAAEFLDSITSWFTGGSNIVEFGKELEELAPHLVSFAKDVSELGDTDISGAVDTAKSIMELASMVPNSGGVAGWWFGENSIAAFGEELKAFAPSLSAFIQETSGITRSSAYGPVEATKLIMEMASLVPNSGGVTGWWFGENNLSSFALELEGFGASIAAFSEETSGITSGSVQGAVDASKLLMEMASIVPNQGGVAGWWFGENSLVLFAEQLGPFGKALKTFKDDVGDISSDSITSAVNATRELVVLAELIPNKGGVSSFFYGDNDFTTFGYTLDTLGKALASFSENSKTLAVAEMTAAIEQVSLIVDMATKLKDLDGVNANSFKDLLNGLGKAGVTGFTESFTNSQEQVRTAMLEMLSYARLAVEEQIPAFGAAGMNIMTRGFEAGIIQGRAASHIAVVELFDKIVAVPGLKEPEIKASMVSLMANAVTQTIIDEGTKISEAFSSILNDLEQVVKRSYNRFRLAGNQIALGLKTGILDKAKEIAEAAAQLVKQALDSANSEADVQSPSKETYWTGQMMALGLANALVDGQLSARDSARQLASSALTALNSSFSDSPHLVITPVLDMNEMTKQTDLLKNSLANSSGTLSLASKAMSTSSPAYTTPDNQNGSGLLGGFNFVQNNYSPKALTRAEVYRQTSNLLATAKGAILPA